MTNIDDFGRFTEEHWSSMENDDPIGLAIMSLGIGGETGEALTAWFKLILSKDRLSERIKKVFRGDPENVSLLRKELGDVIFYWARICKFFGFEPSEIIAENIEKLKSRKDRGKIKGDGDNR